MVNPTLHFVFHIGGIGVLGSGFCIAQAFLRAGAFSYAPNTYLLIINYMLLRS